MPLAECKTVEQNIDIYLETAETREADLVFINVKGDGGKRGPATHNAALKFHEHRHLVTGGSIVEGNVFVRCSRYETHLHVAPSAPAVLGSKLVGELHSRRSAIHSARKHRAHSGNLKEIAVDAVNRCHILVALGCL